MWASQFFQLMGGCLGLMGGCLLSIGAALLVARYLYQQWLLGVVSIIPDLVGASMLSLVMFISTLGSILLPNIYPWVYGVWYRSVCCSVNIWN